MDKIRVTTDTLRSYARQLEDCADVLSDAKSRLQSAVARDPENYEVSEETAREWESNWKNYYVYDQYNWGHTDYDRYYNQPVETDARAFAASVDYGTDD